MLSKMSQHKEFSLITSALKQSWTSGTGLSDKVELTLKIRVRYCDRK